MQKPPGGRSTKSAVEAGIHPDTTGVEAKRARENVDFLLQVNKETCVCAADQMNRQKEQSLHDALEGEMWGHTEHTAKCNAFYPGISASGARQHIFVLQGFNAYKVAPLDQAKNDTNGKWTSSRCEDAIKRSGDVRGIWVRREVPSTPGESIFTATTPSYIVVEMLHTQTHAVQEGHDLVYFDLSRAFVHSPKTPRRRRRRPEE